MKTFTKGSLTTVVDDDDFRIDEYKANGWKETKTADKPKDEADKRTEKAIDDANASEADKKGKNGKKGKAAAPDKKVNDAVAATATAAAESEAVDDGLIKPSAAKATGGKDNG